MKEQVARIIQHRVWATIRAGKPIKGNVLGKSGKAAAIDTIWRNRDELFLAFQMANDKVEFARSLPWIGQGANAPHCRACTTPAVGQGRPLAGLEAL